VVFVQPQGRLRVTGTDQDLIGRLALRGRPLRVRRLPLRQLLLGLSIALTLQGTAACGFGHPAWHLPRVFVLRLILADRFELL
jgi:hypothetical protein